MHHFDNAYLSLLQSSASEAFAGSDERTDAPTHKAIKNGVNKYCLAVANNEEIAKPNIKDQNAEDPGIIAYLASLYHRKAHASIAHNSLVEKQIQEQLAAFKFGNPKWQQMFDQYVKYYWHYPHHKGGQPMYRSWLDPVYGQGDYDYGVINWTIPEDSTVALIGDIGTGTDVAAAVLISALSFNPTIILHVGDVYYSGTEFEFQQYFVGLINSVFEDLKLKVPIYTLPGNHEYFTGAIPYFQCLDSNVLVQTEAQRQQASFFKLRTENNSWQFIGMDTSFHGHYMGINGDKLEAALRTLHVDPKDAYDPVVPPPMVFVRPDEVDWHHHHLSQFPGRTILLGHHQLYSAHQKVGLDQKLINDMPDPADFNRPGVNTALWRDFGLYFNKVAAWFWGHEHNLGIYQNNYRPQGWPPVTNAPNDPWKNLSKGRCVGHSAIPVAGSEEPYKNNNQIPLEDSQLKLDLVDGWYNRGFEIIQLRGKNKPAVTSYYQINGVNPKPIKLYQETIQ